MDATAFAAAQFGMEPKVLMVIVVAVGNENRETCENRSLMHSVRHAGQLVASGTVDPVLCHAAGARL